MRKDAFSARHPAVIFLFFVGVFGAAALIRHPAYLAAGLFAGTAYSLCLQGGRALKKLLGLLPLTLFVTAINPLFNTDGETVLFHVLERPYTAEALAYGGAIAVAFAQMILWFGCYSAVLTADRFTALFGTLMPNVSLLLVMVFRMVPNLLRRAAQLKGARRSVGKGAAENAAASEKLTDGLTVLGALTSLALEESVVTGDSMRARGYGTAKRSSFMLWQWKPADSAVLCGLSLLSAAVIAAAIGGQTAAVFTPVPDIAPLSWGLVPYAVYLLIPVAFYVKEAVQWHILKSRICVFPTLRRREEMR